MPGESTLNITASACYGNTPEGVWIAAASDVLWNNGAICGKTFKVKCTGPTNPVPHPCNDGKTVTVKIVDHCPGCGGTSDLSKEAFATIANPVAGVIKIEYW
ncbi:hypothetical protein CTI12_AA264770 [Artemisia annua]|uniref:Expansin-like EG45 domain-containing protein n=1 Tax=Artemisia annua TaxID=35608 RepID=A0A2U1NHA8_ARTAN|nr:hypothetical protein CTI12_AA264770 [Artemisia annua]